MRLVALTTTLMMFAFACGPGPRPRAPQSSPNSADGQKKIDVPLPPEGDPPPIIDKPISPEDQAQLELVRQTLPSCGISNLDSYRAEKLADQTIESAPWQRKGKGGLLGAQDFVYSLSGSFTYKGSFEQVISSVNVLVKSSGSNLGKDRADQEARARTGSVAATLFPLERRHDLKSKAPVWDSVLCTAQAAARLSNSAEGKRTVADFYPPLPYWISPKADPKRYAAELGSLKSWDTVTATIVESARGLAPGTMVKGSAKVEEVQATASIIGRNGDVVTVSSDVAYKFSYNFESAERTADLGLPASVTFYIDYASDRFKAVVWTTAGVDSVTISQVAE